MRGPVKYLAGCNGGINWRAGCSGIAALFERGWQGFKVKRMANRDNARVCDAAILKGFEPLGVYAGLRGGVDTSARRQARIKKDK